MQTQTEKDLICTTWETSHVPEGFVLDNHNSAVLRRYLVHCPTISIALINRLIEDHKSELHWLAKEEKQPVPKVQHFEDNRVNHARKADAEKLEADKAKAWENEQNKKRRMGEYFVAKSKISGLTADYDINGRVNHSATRSLRKQAVQQLIASFPEYETATKQAFSDYL